MSTLALVPADASADPDSAPPPPTRKRRARRAAPALPLQPRELGDAELLATLLGTPRTDPAIASLATMTWLEIAQVDPTTLEQRVGRKVAARIVAARELGRRLAAADLPWMQRVRGPDDVAGYLRRRYGGEEREFFVAIGLDAYSNLRTVREIAIGTMTSTDVHPREVFRDAIRDGLVQLIVAHNHPSGSAEPSQADVVLTRRLAEAGRMLGIPLMDHVIVTRTQSTSLALRGLVPNVTME